jgi:pimeloyl-ACP methyl ester carboxylesterase
MKFFYFLIFLCPVLLFGQEILAISKQEAKGQGPSTVEVKIDNLVFNCLVAGMSNKGDAVILLHGFPETSHMVVNLMTLLSSKGYRVIAPDQRGNSSGAKAKKSE